MSYYKMSGRLSPKQIGEIAVNYVKQYEIERTGKKPDALPQGQGVDMISDDRYIEIKGVMKKETNIRITNHTMEYVKNEGLLKNFYIYRVIEMGTKPKL